MIHCVPYTAQIILLKRLLWLLKYIYRIKEEIAFCNYT